MEVDKNFDKRWAGKSSSLEVFCEKVTGRKYAKSDSGSGIFLWILQYFWQAFLQNILERLALS